MEKYILNKEEAVLMIIDIQERLIPVMKDREHVIKNTSNLISIANRLNIPLIVTEQYPKGLGNTVNEINSNLKGNPIIEKISFTGFTEEVRDALIKTERNKIIITGMETHVCVFQTVRDLLSHGYHVFLVADAVCSRTRENYLNGLSLMSEMGAVVTNTETVFFDLMKKAGTPEFKTLSKLIK